MRTAPNSATAKAIDYSLKRWVALSRYAEIGDLPIDNNPVENSIRPIALGKKNWLFASSERAGQRAAVIQTLLGTAKLNGLDPAAWLKDALAPPLGPTAESMSFYRSVTSIKSKRQLADDVVGLLAYSVANECDCVKT